MRVALVLLSVSLSACAGSPPEAPLSPVGEWVGEGAQWDDGDRTHAPDSQWPIRVRVLETASGELAATVEYPSFPCSGTLQYVGPSTEVDARPGDAIFRERITLGDDVCVTGGTVLLRYEGDRLIYAWAIDGSPAVAAGRLERDE